MVRMVFVLALLGVMIPSGVHAQTYVVPSCVDPVVTSRSSYAPAVPCIPPVVVPPPVIVPPPMDVPVWLRPTPVVPPAPLSAVPTYTPPVWVAPVPSGGGIDPWIPLAIRPATVRSPLDVMTEMLVLQELTATQPRSQAAPAPARRTPPVQPAVAPPANESWMSAFIKGVKQ